ncbi:flippase [Clostridium celatum]|uniref:flippase n=1 Tax=Clostridium celatum TaxID=36834 RepID=UPI001898CC8C|nr:flippase [Clostridium celatum]
MNLGKYNRVFKNFLALFTLQGLNYILPMVTVPYLTRVLGPANYGKTIFAASIIVYFQVITDYGFGMSATRNISLNRENKERVNEIFSAVIWIKLALTTLCFFVLLIMINSIPRLRGEYLLYLFTYLGVLGNALFPIWLFQGLEEMKYITYLNVVIRVLYTISIFIFIRSTDQYTLLPLISSLVNIIIGLVSLLVIFKKFNIRLKKTNLNTIKVELVDGWHLFVTSIFSNFVSNGGNLMIGALLGDTMVGYYGAIDKITKSVIALFSPITTALFPFINRRFKKSAREGIQEIKKLGILVTLGSCFVAAIMFFGSWILVRLLCGGAYVDYSDILKIHAFWLVASIVNNFLGIQLLIGMGQGKYYTRAFVVAGIITIGTQLLLVSPLSVFSIPTGMLIGEVVLTIIMIFIIKYKVLKIVDLDQPI